MVIHTLLFNLYASLALTAGLGVIFSKNPINSVIFLILVFCNATGLLLLFKIELLAMMFIIIYVGAIAVLFLFVVMMLNLKINELTKNNTVLWIGKTKIQIAQLIKSPLVLSTLIFSILTISFLKTNTWNIPITNYPDLNMLLNEFNNLWSTQNGLQKEWIKLVTSETNIQSLGNLIYTYYFYYFFMAGLILLIAMIGAIVLTMYKRKQASKKQIIYKQIARNFKTALAYTI